MHFLLLPEVGRLSLRTGRLLSFDGAVGHHVGNALAEVAFLRLWGKLAFFGVVIQAAAVVASGKGKTSREVGGDKERKQVRRDDQKWRTYQ